MSHSVKKSPIAKCWNSESLNVKKCANKKFRCKFRNKLNKRQENNFDYLSITQPSFYKKVSDSWDIWDMKSFHIRHSLEYARKEYDSNEELQTKYGSFEDYLNQNWAKYYKRK